MTNRVETLLAREIGALRSELHTEIGGLRSEMHSEIGGLRGELHTELHAMARTTSSATSPWCSPLPRSPSGPHAWSDPPTA